MSSTVDFGPAQFYLSKRLQKTLLVVQSLGNDTAYFRFRSRSTRGESKYYSCLRCADLGMNRLVTVKHGRIVGRRHPSLDHHPGCFPVPEADFEVLIQKREMGCEARKGQITPRALFDRTTASLTQKYGNRENLYLQMVQKWPAFHSVRSVLARHRAHDRVSIPDSRLIPEEYLVTLRGRHMTGTRFFLEPWHLCSSNDGRIHIFADEWDLKAFHASTVVLADGTFKYCPGTSYQLYNIFCYLHGEGVHCGFALLPAKEYDVYVEMWGAYRSASEQLFGPLGPKRILIDYESGAIPALRHVFPMFTLKGCSFHFRQCIFRNIQFHGLQPVYQNDSVPGVKQWLRQIMAMTLLPAAEIRPTWAFLGRPPPVADPGLAQSLERFRDYVQMTWISSAAHPPEMWSHFETPKVGPRTTNFAEGFHGKLQHSFSTVHPPLAAFLEWLQIYHHSNQVRLQQLLDPHRRPDPTPQELKYRLLNEEIHAAKDSLVDNFQNYVIPSNSDPDVYRDVILEYLSRCAYLVGAN